MRDKPMKNHKPELTQAQRDELKAFASIPDDEIDTSDIPETRDWSGAVRGLFHMLPDERRKALKELRSRRVTDIHTNGSDLEDLPTSSPCSEVGSRSHTTD